MFHFPEDEQFFGHESGDNDQRRSWMILPEGLPMVERDMMRIVLSRVTAMIQTDDRDALRTLASRDIRFRFPPEQGDSDLVMLEMPGADGTVGMIVFGGLGSDAPQIARIYLQVETDQTEVDQVALHSAGNILMEQYVQQYTLIWVRSLFTQVMRPAHRTETAVNTEPEVHGYEETSKPLKMQRVPIHFEMSDIPPHLQEFAYDIATQILGFIHDRRSDDLIMLGKYNIVVLEGTTDVVSGQKVVKPVKTVSIMLNEVIELRIVDPKSLMAEELRIIFWDEMKSSGAGSEGNGTDRNELLQMVEAWIQVVYTTITVKVPRTKRYIPKN